MAVRALAIVSLKSVAVSSPAHGLSVIFVTSPAERFRQLAAVLQYRPVRGPVNPVFEIRPAFHTKLTDSQTSSL